jgi:putative ubiquitin-RnfH superfamily antitoxin RatB of RatAB toxin-antitoxin module
MSEITVSVVYALPERATEIEVRLSCGATVADAIARSRIAEQHPEIDFARAATGIFGREVRRDATLADGDRVEIYRPLRADAKEVRRRRAKRA